jgi:hypothetical protein
MSCRKPRRIETGDQHNLTFWREFKARHMAPFDVIIDDASHVAERTIATFREMWPHLSEGGIYLVRGGPETFRYSLVLAKTKEKTRVFFSFFVSDATGFMID